jgi:hypothetical protein
MARGLKLPCIFVIENNQFAYSTPVSMQTASHDFAGKAAAYGFPGVKVDGTNALAVYDAGQLVFSGGVTAPVPVVAGAVSHSSSAVWGPSRWPAPDELGKRVCAPINRSGGH